VATKTVTLTFGPAGIEASPDPVVVDGKADTICWDVTAEASDVITVDLEERVKGDKKVKGPFKKHATQGKRGVFTRVGPGTCETAACDQLPARAPSEVWKYDVIWRKGKTVARLDPAIKIVK
jgi:hypothetical protein